MFSNCWAGLLVFVVLAGLPPRAAAEQPTEYLLCDAEALVEVEVRLDSNLRPVAAQIVRVYWNGTGRRIPRATKAWQFRARIPANLGNPALPGELRRLYERAVARGSYRVIVWGTLDEDSRQFVVAPGQFWDSRVNWLDHPAHRIWWRLVQAFFRTYAESGKCDDDEVDQRLHRFRRFDEKQFLP